MERKKMLGIMIVLGFWVLLGSCSSEKEEKDLDTKAWEIHQRVLTVDTHCDTPSLIVRRDWDMGVHHRSTKIRGKIDLPRMKEGGLDAAFFAVFVGQGETDPEGYQRAKGSALELLQAIHKMTQDYPDLVELAATPEDAYRLEREGKRAAFIGLENGYPIGEDLSSLRQYYQKGVRYLTLCHSSDNQICDSSTDKENSEDNGLSEFGSEVVAECNRMGIMVDVSHVSDQSFFDVLEITQAPVIASHSCVRAICDHPRNLSDEMIKALASNGGVIQVCFVSSFVKKLPPNPERDKALAELREKYGPWSKIRDEATLEKLHEEYMKINQRYPEDKATVAEMVDHIDHVVDLVGIDHVGIGTDFDGGGELKGCGDVSQMCEITKELLARGYKEEDIQKIWGGNIMRVFGEVIEIGKKSQSPAG